jgi:phosphate:Na+ symporter
MLTLLHLLGAVALLIWGTHMVQSGILRAYGGPLRTLLGNSVNQRGKAFAAGLVITTLIQSGTATTLMISSFVAQGLMRTSAALAVVLGADVGSSLIAQVISLKVDWLSPLLLLVGIVLFRADRSQVSRNTGRAALGLGLMILALQLIGSAVLPISQGAGMQVIIRSLTGDMVLVVLFAALLTLLAHSSLAIVLLVVSLVDSAAIPASAGLALVLGANLGSSISPLLSGAGGGNASQRVPLANLMFKAVACVAVAPFLATIEGWIALLDPDRGRRMLHFHTAFNLLTAAAFLFLTGPVAALCERLLPVAQNADDPTQPRHLDGSVIHTPEVAVSCAAREAMRIGDLIERMLRDSLTVLCNNDATLIRPIAQLENGVDTLYKAIKSYLMQINREELSPLENQRWADIIALTINLEHIGDIIDKNLMDVARRKIDAQLSFSESGNAEIADLHQRLLANLRLGLNLFMHPDVKHAQRLLEEKSRFNELERIYAENHLRRLTDNKLQSIATSALHLDVIRDLRRINSHLCALAYPILDAAGLLRKNRLRSAPQLAEPLPSIPASPT